VVPLVLREAVRPRRPLPATIDARLHRQVDVAIRMSPNSDHVSTQRREGPPATLWRVQGVLTPSRKCKPVHLYRPSIVVRIDHPGRSQRARRVARRRHRAWLSCTRRAQSVLPSDDQRTNTAESVATEDLAGARLGSHKGRAAPIDLPIPSDSTPPTTFRALPPGSGQ